MKAIITRQSNGQFDEVGMRNRFVTTAKRLSTIVKRAREFGDTCCIECFPESAFYKEPFAVYIVHRKRQ